MAPMAKSFARGGIPTADMARPLVGNILNPEHHSIAPSIINLVSMLQISVGVSRAILT